MLQSTGSRHTGFSSYSMWDLPGPVIEPMSPALAGRFLTTAPPWKSPDCFLIWNFLKKNFFDIFYLWFIESVDLELADTEG